MTNVRTKSLVPLAALSLCLCLTSTHSVKAQQSSKPWLAAAKPTVLEWVILELQASENDHEFGENGVTVQIYGNSNSAATGTVYCKLRYLPTTPQEMIELVENGIRERFEYIRASYPWAKLLLVKESAGTKATR